MTYITVDKGDDSWKGRVGLVPIVLKEVAPSPLTRIAWSAARPSC